MADRSLEGMALPLEVRARLAELELELSEGESGGIRALQPRGGDPRHETPPGDALFGSVTPGTCRVPSPGIPAAFPRHPCLGNSCGWAARPRPRQLLQTGGCPASEGHPEGLAGRWA